MQQRSLLLVDDDTFLLTTTAKFFRQSSFTVYTAINGKDCLELARLHRPQCILLDYMLPDTTGGKVAMSIRGDHDLCACPIVLFTGDDTLETSARYDFQVDSFILKGTPFTKMLAVIESLLRRVDLDHGMLHKDDLLLCERERYVLRDGRPAVVLSPEQFRFLWLLVKKSPEFVPEETLCGYVFGHSCAQEKADAIKLMAYRLRQHLGPQLGRRIKSSKASGWIYLPSRRLLAERA